MVNGPLPPMLRRKRIIPPVRRKASLAEAKFVLELCVQNVFIGPVAWD